MFYCVGLGPPDDPSLQGVKQSVGVCNCVLLTVNIILSLLMNCLLNILQNTSTSSISVCAYIYRT